MCQQIGWISLFRCIPREKMREGRERGGIEGDPLPSTTMAAWDHELHEMFRQHDKDMSGFIGKEDIICMLLGADGDDKKDPVFKTNLKFLINVIKEADKDGDAKISFEEFKDYINKATQ